MRLTLAEPGYLKESISIISDLVNEARFKITPDAIEMVAMDPANVAMVVFKLLSSSFTEYDVKKDIEIGINLSNLKQVLRRASSKDMLTIEMDDDNRLKIQLESSTTRTFNLPIIDLEEKEQKVPDLKFPVTIKTSSSVLNEAIADVDVVGESVAFIAEPKKFTLHAEGDLNQAKIEIKEYTVAKISLIIGESNKDEKIIASIEVVGWNLEELDIKGFWLNKEGSMSSLFSEFQNFLQQSTTEIKDVTLIGDKSVGIVKIRRVQIEYKPFESGTRVIINSDNGKLKAKYSIEYLKKMINGSKLSDDVVIQFSKDYPLKLEYKAIDKVMLSFILAPRVEND